jgi:hypothetical protein
VGFAQLFRVIERLVGKLDLNQHHPLR